MEELPVLRKSVMSSSSESKDGFFDLKNLKISSVYLLVTFGQ